jgi:hypothetical protein
MVKIFRVHWTTVAERWFHEKAVTRFHNLLSRDDPSDLTQLVVVERRSFNVCIRDRPKTQRVTSKDSLIFRSIALHIWVSSIRLMAFYTVEVSNRLPGSRQEVDRGQDTRLFNFRL